MSNWTDEARQGAATRAKTQWKGDRSARITAMNKAKPANCIRELRLSIPMTQSEFAAGIGLSDKNTRTVGSYERGLEPTPERLEAIQKLAEKHGKKFTYTR